MTTKEFAKILQDKLTSEYGVDLSIASHQQIYRALALICRQMMSENHKKFQSKAIGTGSKQVYYLCMEFLMGRSLKMSLFNLGLNDAAQKALAEADISLDSIYEEEPDAGLGNGGLGRLAACYLDGMATTSICGTGYSILYEYGIFKQKIVDGWQQERADNWLPGGQVWLKSHPDQAVEVRFDGEIHENWDHGFHYIQHTNYNSVMAIPSDMYVQGYDGKGVAKLRLWQAKAPDFDMSSFSLGNYNTAMSKNASAELISKVLYPNDNHVEGKILRLRQQYFLSAASIGDIVQNHLSTYGTLENLPDKVAIQLNDTHPTLAIPEMMRILLDECGFGWDKSFDICQKVFAYTNHTVLAEALERWPQQLIEKWLPRIWQILIEISNRYQRALTDYFHGDLSKVAPMAIIWGGEVRMANLCVCACSAVNGVSALHSDILKRDVFHDAYLRQPDQFKNVTNGIDHRRWLSQINPKLDALVRECTGGDDYLLHPDAILGLEKYKNDKAVLERLEAIKKENKRRFASYLARESGVMLNTDAIFDVQVKRLHEYKRQLLNVLHIIYLYQRMKADPHFDFTPRTYLFGAKAAPGYAVAKRIIRLINSVADMIARDPACKDRLQVVFLENYRVSLAEKLMPASELSEQISTAGKEASGTGNMKFMMNGALTVGTLDGANVEMHEVLGDENMFLFGLRADEVEQLKREGYVPQRLYRRDEKLRRCLDALRTGFRDGVRYDDLYQRLLFGAGGSPADEYLLLADFQAYCEAEQRMARTYRDPIQWNRMSLHNIARSGIFAADRAVAEYADNIWHVPHK